MARFIDFRPDHSVPGRRETGKEFINAKYIKKVYLVLPFRNEIRIDTVDKMEIPSLLPSGIKTLKIAEPE